jgi:hypothetical protein
MMVVFVATVNGGTSPIGPYQASTWVDVPL